MFGSNHEHSFDFVAKTFSELRSKVKDYDFLEKTLFMGDGKKLIEFLRLAQLQLSEKTVADYAPVIINAHGNRTKDGHHTIDLIDSSTISLDDIFADRGKDITAIATSPISTAGFLMEYVEYTDNCFKLLSKVVDKALFV